MSDSKVNTHSFLTCQGVEILKHQKNIIWYNQSLIDNLVKGSVLPDSIENDGGLFIGHFYNPVTHDSYNHSKTLNAYTRFISHYTNAIAMNMEGRTNEDTCCELGMALHYLEDVTEPHHAANIANYLNTHFSDDHMEFENWVKEQSMKKFQISHSKEYDFALNNSPGDILIKAAQLGNCIFLKYHKDCDIIKSKWKRAAFMGLTYAQQIVAAVLYKFAVDIGAVTIDSTEK